MDLTQGFVFLALADAMHASDRDVALAFFSDGVGDVGQSQVEIDLADADAKDVDTGWGIHVRGSSR